MPQNRKLTKKEQRFVDQIERGAFMLDFTRDGSPYGMGARHTGNLFDADLDVKEGHDPDGGSSYWLEGSS